MSGFREAFRQGRDQARAARGAPPLSDERQDAAPKTGRSRSHGTRHLTPPGVSLRRASPIWKRRCVNATTNLARSSAYSVK